MFSYSLPLPVVDTKIVDFYAICNKAYALPFPGRLKAVRSTMIVAPKLAMCFVSTVGEGKKMWKGEGMCDYGDESHSLLLVLRIKERIRRKRREREKRKVVFCCSCRSNGANAATHLLHVREVSASLMLHIDRASSLVSGRIMSLPR